MKTFIRMPFISSLLLLSLVVTMVVPAMSVANSPPGTVDLGTTESFAILAGSGITVAGDASTTNISGEYGGNVGLSPTTGNAITGLMAGTGGNVEGTIYTVDEVPIAGSVMDPDRLIKAKEDLTAAYGDATARTPTTTFPDGNNQLGGLILTTGVYRLGAATTYNLSGTLTLDAQGDDEAVFIFQAPSTLITAENSVIKLINGAKFCRVFWQVGSSATLGAGSTFVGHIFADASITANTGATVYGQLLAQAAVTMEGSNTIINGPCPTTTPKIQVKKYVSVDGGTTWLDAESAPGPSAVIGSTVKFKFVITNTGNVTLTDITLTDSVYVLGATLPSSLAATGTFEYIQDETAAAGLHQNTATATGKHEGVTYSDTDHAHYLGYVPDASTIKQLPITSGYYSLLIWATGFFMIIGGILLKIKTGVRKHPLKGR